MPALVKGQKPQGKRLERGSRSLGKQNRRGFLLQAVLREWLTYLRMC